MSFSEKADSLLCGAGGGCPFGPPAGLDNDEPGEQCGGCSLEWKNRACSGEGAQAALEAARSSQMSEQGSVLNSERQPGWFPGKGSLSSQEVELKPGLGQQESRNPGNRSLTTR